MAVIHSVFFNGKKENEERPIAEITAALADARPHLHAMKADEILALFDAFSRELSGGENARPGRGGAHLKDLANFLKKENLGKNLDLALRGSRRYLDGFVKPEGHDFFLHAQPRGLAVEWLAGNIPFLGMYSLAEALVTKNALIIKAPSRNYEVLRDLLEALARVAGRKEQWGNVMRCVSAVLVERDNTEAQEELSMAADARMIWGGEESARAIMALPKNFWTEDIVYGPKYSYAVISRRAKKDRMSATAAALAADIANFDQYACSSPHTVFVEDGGAVGAEQFARLLGDALDRVGRLLIPKGPADPAEVLRIMTARADYAAKGTVIVPSDKSTEWTVIVTDEPGFAPPAYSRTVFVKPIKDLRDLALLNSRTIQTIGFSGADAGAGEEDFDKLDALTLHGGDRIPAPGAMSFFSSPWDGAFAMDRLVRWVRFL